METAIQWRAKFIELAVELRRLAGKPAKAFVDTPEATVRMKFHIDGVLFNMVHFCDDEGSEAPERFLLQCRFGPVPLLDAAPVLEEALAMNQGMARGNAGMFALDTQTNELVCSSLQTLQGAQAQDLAEGLAKMAEVANQWRAAHPVVLH
jgi:hypothetical protein